MDSLKYYLDMIQMLLNGKEKIDLESLFKRSIRDRTYKRIKFALGRIYESMPELERFYVVDQKNRARKLRNPETYLAFIHYQFFTYDKVSHSFIEIKRWFFPSKIDLKMELAHDLTSYREGIKELYHKRWAGFTRRVE